MLARNDDEDDEFDLVDRAALELAIKLTLEEKDQGRVAQVKSMLADLQRPWSETACFCAYHRQARVLDLHPWEEPPCHIYPDDEEYMAIRGPRHVTAEAVTLLKRMLDAGISRYHPDPLAALEAAKRRANK